MRRATHRFAGEAAPTKRCVTSTVAASVRFGFPRVHSAHDVLVTARPSGVLVRGAAVGAAGVLRGSPVGRFWGGRGSLARLVGPRLCREGSAVRLVRSRLRGHAGIVHCVDALADLAARNAKDGPSRAETEAPCAGGTLLAAAACHE
jgi:hypothetical protein